MTASCACPIRRRLTARRAKQRKRHLHPDGSLQLIDWDTVAVAPRERDLALILDGSAEVLAAYQRTAGPITPRSAALELFTHWWALADISEFVQLLRRPHEDTADTAESWRSLCHNAYQVSST